MNQCHADRASLEYCVCPLRLAVRFVLTDKLSSHLLLILTNSNASASFLKLTHRSKIIYSPETQGSLSTADQMANG